jgi:hypothetical protein
MDRQVHELKEKIRDYREKAESLESDQEFLKRQALDAKRKNKLLKTAIQRMQLAGMGGHCPKCIAEKPFKESLKEELDKNPFFITEHQISQAPTNASQDMSLSVDMSKSKRNNKLYNSQVIQDSLLEPSSMLNLSLGSHRQSPRAVGNHSKNIKILDDPNTPPGKGAYSLPPTENLKFEKFLDIILNPETSRIPVDQAKEEIIKYV